MSYTPTTWQTGDTITAEKLNNMESGIEGNSVFLITVALNESYINKADKTYSEIQTAYQSGKTLVCVKDNARYELAQITASYFIFTCGLSNAIYKIQINSNNSVSTTQTVFYSKPQTGIPQSDLAQAVQNKLDPFVVTLTPTAQDYSGVMDKTPAEISEAYFAGREIRAVVPALDSSFVFTQFILHDLDEDGVDDTVQVATNFWYNDGTADLYMAVLTSSQDSAYWVHSFVLTPVS